jgi:Uma2 family endonuclease
MQTVKAPPKISFSPLLRRYTLEEFWDLPEPVDGSHYELIAGILFTVPPPPYSHGDLDARLNRQIIEFLFTTSIVGHVYHPQAAIYREATWGTCLTPDMMYVSDELREQMGKLRPTADIVFEYTSANSSIYDTTTKADTYLALDVRELWLINSDERTIEVRHKISTEETPPAWEATIFLKGGVAKSRVLSGWEVSLEELFAGLDE